MIRAAGKFVLHTSTVLFGLVVVVIAGVSAAAYRLTQGPVSIGFMVPYVEDALTTQNGDYQLRIDDTILIWGGWEKTLEIQIIGVQILDKTETVVARIPKATLDLSGRALFSGMLAPTKLVLFGAHAKLSRLADGRLIFGLSGDEQSSASNTSGTVLVNLIRRLASPPDMTEPLGYLHQVKMTDADLEIFDQPSGTLWHGQHTDLTLSRDQDGIRALLNMGIQLGDIVWDIEATGNYDPDRRVIDLSLHFGEFEPAELAAAYENFSVLAPLTLPMSGSISFALGTEGSAPKAPTIEFDISAGPGFVSLPAHYDEPLPIDNLSARGRLDQDLGQVVIEDLFVSAGNAELSAQGLVLYGPDGNGAILDATFNGLPVEDLTRYWPKGVKPKSRKWIQENLSNGVIRDGVVKISINPGDAKDGKLPENALDLRFAFDGMTARYMRTLPLITNLAAQGHITARRLELTEGIGQVGGLKLTEGRFSILDMSVKPPTAEAEFVVKGPSKAALHLLDSDQFNFLSKVGLTADDVGGESATRARLVFPLSKTLSVKDVSFTTAANMGALTMPTQLEGLRVTDGTIELQADSTGLSAAGDIELNGVPVGMTWIKEFGRPDQIDSRYHLSGELDAADREALNIPIADYLHGTVSGSVDIANQGQTLVGVSGNLDLTAGVLAVPPLGWTKPAGVAGTLKFEMTPDAAGGFAVDTMHFTIDGFEAKGRAHFGPGFSVDSVDLDRLAFGETDVKFALTRTDKDGFNVDVTGASYDLRPILAAEKSPRAGPETDEEPGTPITIVARLNQVIMGDTQVLNDVTATAHHTGSLWQKAEITGMFGDHQPLTLSLVTNDGIRKLTIKSDDAGSVGKAMDIYKNMDGGTLTLTALFDDRKASQLISGRLIVNDFRVVNAPIMAKILTVGSLTGIVNRLQGEGIKFERLVSDFTYENKVLKVTETRAYGPAVGFNIVGSLDNNTKFANFVGTVVPAYTLNTALGKVPVLGDLLLGGEGEGVFAITYTINGPWEKPRVTVNPLSVLAPGFLRGIIAILTPEPKAPKPTEQPAQAEPPSAPTLGPAEIAPVEASPVN